MRELIPSPRNCIPVGFLLIAGLVTIAVLLGPRLLDKSEEQVILPTATSWWTPTEVSVPTATPSATVKPTETSIITPSASAMATSTGSLALTPAPTPTETSTPAPIPTPTLVLAAQVHLTTSAERVRVGDNLTVTVVLENSGEVVLVKPRYQLTGNRPHLESGADGGKLVQYGGDIAVGSTGEVTFVLRAVTEGEATLQATVLAGADTGRPSEREIVSSPHGISILPVTILGVALEGYNTQSGLEEALKLGAHWLRRWQHISWRDVEPREGEYHWWVLDGLEEELLRLRAHGAEPLIVIQMTPEWAQEVVPYACGPIRYDKFGAFAAFMEELVMRYGSATQYGVRYWQLGNELDVAPREVRPDSVYGCWGDESDPYYHGEHYGRMLAEVYPRIKAVDPEAQVVMGGLLLECDPYTETIGYECRSERRGYFLEGVLRAGGGEHFDVIDVHSYAQLRLDLPSRMHSYYGWSGGRGGTGLPEKTGFVRKVLEQYGYGNKPVIAGELALKCDEPTPVCHEVAAAFVPRVYAEAYELDLLGGVYYALISEFKYKGLLLPDFTPRPAYWAYRFMNSQLADAQYIGPVNGYEGVSGSAFDKGGGRRIEIIWSSDGTNQVLDSPAGFVGAYDKFGTEVALVNGQLSVGWSPLYVELK
jgi:hypothetical protein